LKKLEVFLPIRFCRQNRFVVDVVVVDGAEEEEEKDGNARMTTTGESLEIKKAARVIRVWEKKDTHFLLHFFKRCGEGDDDYDDDFFSFGESTLTEDDDDAPYDDADANEVLVLARRKKSSRRSKRLLRRDYESHHAEKRGGDSRGKSAQKLKNFPLFSNLGRRSNII
jgi:hypothetical protein